MFYVLLNSYSSFSYADKCQVTKNNHDDNC